MEPSRLDTIAAPPAPSTITDGAISGTLPAAEAFVIHYPGYPSSPSRAAHSLGGLPAIAKARSSEPNGALELRFRPEDPYCHPTFAEIRRTTGLLLRLARPKSGDGMPSANIVARVCQAYHFEGMADFQHVLPLRAAEMRRSKRLRRSNDTLDLGNEKKRGVEMDEGDVMMLVPPLFSIKDRPTKIALLPSPNVFSKSMQRGVVEHRWEMDVGPTLALSFNIEVVPTNINWEDHITKSTIEWSWQMAVCKLFEERPVWPRQSLYERLLDDGVEVSNNQFRRLLFRAGYYFSTGPFGKFWIRRGYDPRKDPESRIFQRVDFRVPPELRNLGIKNDTQSTQRWKELCQFEVIPSKSFIFLQLFELVDDFIQEEIRKPPSQTTCSHSTGWFSKPMIRTLRLHVSIRFLSLYPNEIAKDLLRVAHVLIERSKKKETLCRSQPPGEENKKIDEELSAELNSTVDQVGLDNYESEDEDDKEEEDDRESDGYDSPAVVDGGDFISDESHILQEGFPSEYLEEVLRSFPVREDSQNQVGDVPSNVEISDGGFEIYGQSSDDEGCSDG